METINGRIEEAGVYKISQLYRKRPRGISIGLTDAVVLTTVTEDRRKVKDTFYVRLKADGTFTTSVIGSDVKNRQERLAGFLRQYITKDIKNYNVKKEIGNWKGKDVKVVPYESGGYIYIV